MRCCGVALKQIQLAFAETHALNNIQLDLEIAIDLNTEGDNY